MTDPDPTPPPQLEAAVFPKYRILHVEDYVGYPEITRLKVLRTLKEYGYKSEDFEYKFLRDCPTESETKDVLEWEPDVILFDFFLTTGTSVSFCEAVKDLDCIKYYLTFYGNEVDKLKPKLMEWGVSDILEKDSLTESLYKLVNAFQQTHPLQEQPQPVCKK